MLNQAGYRFFTEDEKRGKILDNLVEGGATMEQRENDIKLGRFLCLILRHHPEEAGITLDEDN